MFEKLTELAQTIRDLPKGTVLDDSLRADLLGRIASIGRGQPQASTGKSWAEFEAEVRGMYPGPGQSLAVPPSGPPGPKPPPSPPAVPEDPPAFRNELDDGHDTSPTATKRPR